jgi:hypothetical protein
MPIETRPEDVRALKAMAQLRQLGEGRELSRRLAGCVGTENLASLIALTAQAEALLEIKMTAEPFSASRTSNWVARAGGLPHYIQHIAHDLVEKRGLPESVAIAMAIGIVKRWARGGGNVTPKTRALAAEAVAQWEAMRARARAKPGKAFDESAVRRWPTGDKRGGRFRPKLGGAVSQAVRAATGTPDVGATVDDMFQGKRTHTDPGHVRDVVQAVARRFEGGGSVQAVAARAGGKPKPPNLMLLHVDGADHGNLFDKHETEIPRNKMPVVPSEPQDAEKLRKFLQGRGAKASVQRISPLDLHASQSQLDPVKTEGICANLITPHPHAMDNNILVADRHGAILDGHHRWSAGSLYQMDGHPDFKLTVLQVDMELDQLISETRAWDKTVGLTPKEFGAKAMSNNALEGEPPGPPPDNKQPWIWLDGQWYVLVSDDLDGVDPAQLPDPVPSAGKPTPAPRFSGAGKAHRPGATADVRALQLAVALEHVPQGRALARRLKALVGSDQEAALISATAQGEALLSALRRKASAPDSATSLAAMITAGQAYIDAESDPDDQDTMRDIVDQLTALRDKDEVEVEPPAD